jgi:hypothetical protein
VLITVSADDPEDEGTAARLINEYGVHPPAYIRRSGNDDRFIKAVDPAWSGALPALFLFDRHRRPIRSWVGESSLADVETLIRKLL